MLACACASVHGLLIIAYVHSQSIRPMFDFANSNWRDDAAILTAELPSTYCIERLPNDCAASAIVTTAKEQKCESLCKAAWVTDADASMKPLGHCLSILSIVIIMAMVMNGHVLLGVDGVRDVTWLLNLCLFVFSLTLTVQATAAADESALSKDANAWVLSSGALLILAALCGIKGVSSEEHHHLLLWSVRALV